MNWTLLITASLGVLKRRHHGRDYRFQSNLTAGTRGGQGVASTAVVEDLWLYGCRLLAPSNVDFDDDVGLIVQFPNGPLSVPGPVTQRSAAVDGQRHLGIRFIDLPDVQRQRIFEYLFVSLARRQYPPLLPVETDREAERVAP